MVDASIYENLPDEPELAFIILEDEMRKECGGQIRNLYQNDRADIYWAKYIAEVQSSAADLGLNFTGIPNQEYIIANILIDDFIDFRQKVFSYTARLKIRTGKIIKQFSVKLDASTRGKLRNYIDEIKKMIDQLDISPEKRDALFARVSALEAEINRDRTRFDVVAAFWLECCTKLGEGVDKIEPIRKWIDPIGNLLGHAKSEERGRPETLISSSPKQEKITDQRSKSESIDDDIPF